MAELSLVVDYGAGCPQFSATLYTDELYSEKEQAKCVLAMIPHGWLRAELFDNDTGEHKASFRSEIEVREV